MRLALLVLSLLAACEPAVATTELTGVSTPADLAAVEASMQAQIDALEAQVATLQATVTTLQTDLQAEATTREEGDVYQQEDINWIKEQLQALQETVSGWESGTETICELPQVWFSEELLGEGTGFEDLSSVEITVSEDRRLAAFCQGAPIAGDAVQLQIILFDEDGAPIDGSSVQVLNGTSSSTPGVVAAYAFDVEAGTYTIACEGSSSRGYTSSWVQVIEAKAGG